MRSLSSDDRSPRQPTIERSAGLLLTSGSPCVVGGGHTGVSAELDAVVLHAADLLRSAYGRDVTVRFNSTRERGSAWLVTHRQDRVGRNADVGLWAEVTTAHGLEELVRVRAENGPDGFADPEQLGPVGTIRVGVHLSERYAPGPRYEHAPRASLDEALRYALAHAAPGSLPAIVEQG
jgi:hypothetical protein